MEEFLDKWQPIVISCLASFLVNKASQDRTFNGRQHLLDKINDL